MNSNDRGDEAVPFNKAEPPPSSLQRSSSRSDEERPTGGDSKPKEDKEGWVHTPSGLRPARIFSRPAETSLAASSSAGAPIIPRAVVTDAGFRDSAVESAQAPAPWETRLATKLVMGIFFLFGLLIAFKVGEFFSSEPQPAGTALPAATPPPLLPAGLSPQELLPALDIALELQRNGKSLQALDFLNKLMAAHPKAPSLEYATAVAAYQAGFPKEADRLADESIKRGYRLSDSWILKATIASSQSNGGAARQESLLREAISADPMNPDGFIELASLLRNLGRNAEASSLLASAALRLDAAAAQTVVETTRAILAVDLADVPAAPSEPLGIPSKDFPNAYSEMKRGNFENAAAILRFCRSRTTPELFNYLVHDPSLKKFSSRPELKEFY